MTRTVSDSALGNSMTIGNGMTIANGTTGTGTGTGTGTTGTGTTGTGTTGTGTTGTGTTGTGSQQTPSPNWLVPLLVLIAGSFLSALDSSIVNVAIPKIQAELSASADDVAWAVTGFTLMLGIIVPVTGWLGSRLGETRLYIYALLGFAVASALCGLAWNLYSLIAFRVLQAIPGGIMPVISLTLLYRIVPPAKIATAMSIYVVGSVLAPGIGPVVGGYFVEYVDWRLIFFINVPIAVVGTAAAVVVFPSDRPTSWPSFDLWGFVTIAYGLFAMLLALSEGQLWGWGGYRILILLTSGALSLATFVVIELEVDNPLIDLRIMKSWPYTCSLLLIAVISTALFTVLYYGPQFLQGVQGQQALTTGLIMAPGAFMIMMLTPISGKFNALFGARVSTIFGLLILAYGLFQLGTLTPDTTTPHVTLWVCIVMGGLGFCYSPAMTSGLSTLSPELTSSGTGMNNVVQRAASSIAVAGFGALGASAGAQLMSDRGALIATGARALPQVAAAQEQGAAGLLGLYQALQNSVTTETYANGFYLAGILALAGAVLALTMKGGRPDPGAAAVHVEM
jgi:EmrB/QacA subfamily drug resistance transporter